MPLEFSTFVGNLISVPKQMSPKVSVMNKSLLNSKAVSNILFVSSLVVIMAVSLIAGLFSGQIMEQNQTSTIQRNYDSLQTSYDQIKSNYQNIQTQLTSLQSQLYDLQVSQEKMLNQNKTGTNGGTEYVSIFSVLVSGRIIDVLANSQNGQDVYITRITLKELSGNTAAVDNSSSITLPGSGTLTDIKVDFASSNLSNGTYTITLTSSKGNNFVSQAFTIS